MGAHEESPLWNKTGFQMIGGIIDFDPDKQKDLVGGDKLTYDEYLDLQLISCESKERYAAVSLSAITTYHLNLMVRLKNHKSGDLFQKDLCQWHV